VPPLPPEEVSPPTPTEVKPPPPEEVKPPPPKVVKPPRRKVARQTVAVMRVPALSAQDASWSAKLLHEAFVKLREVAVHLGVQPPSHPLQTTVMDYTFKINVLGTWREECSPHLRRDDDGGLDVSGSDSDSDAGAPPAATTST
jgi:hypothetical protein